VLALVVLLPKKTNIPPATPPPASIPAPEADLKPIPVPVPTPVATVPVTAAVTNVDTNTLALAKEKHAEYVEKRRDELMAAAMFNDTASHQVIIQELTNSDHAIRKVALEAVQQTQDRALIPQMQQIADTTEDEDYKQALNDAIAYMKLPTLTEIMQQQKAAQQNGGNQATPSEQPSEPGAGIPPPKHPLPNPGGSQPPQQ
jgi:hypothetical protein